MLVLQRPQFSFAVALVFLILILILIFVPGYLIGSMLLGVFLPTHCVQIGYFVQVLERLLEQVRFGVEPGNVRSCVCYAEHSHREQMG